MDSYPTLAEMGQPFRPEAFAAFGYDEDERANIAADEGLDHLRYCDHFARAKVELGVSSNEQAIVVNDGIAEALGRFMFRGIPSGNKAHSPKKLKQAIGQIVKGASDIAIGLDALISARRDIVAVGDPRAEALAHLHTAILGCIASDALPVQLTQKFSLDDIADCMPEIGVWPDFANAWADRFSIVAHRVNRIGAAFPASDFDKPFKRKAPQEFVDFVHRLAAIYRKVAREPAAANKPTATQPQDWQSPFVRFLSEVWPLTPEGSAGEAVPHRARVARALKAPPSFLATATAQEARGHK